MSLYQASLRVRIKELEKINEALLEALRRMLELEQERAIYLQTLRETHRPPDPSRLEKMNLNNAPCQAEAALEKAGEKP